MVITPSWPTFEGASQQLTDLLGLGEIAATCATRDPARDVRSRAGVRRQPPRPPSMPRLTSAGGRAAGDVAQALINQPARARLGGGAVTGNVVGLGGDFCQLGAQVLVRSSSSISRAMDTPSLVMTGSPHRLSSTTLRRAGQGLP